MLTPDQVAEIAAELAEADRAHTVIPRITARYPDATVEDSYAIQGVWRDRMIATGRGYRDNLVGTGKDDASDALDRRVEFKVVGC